MTHPFPQQKASTCIATTLRGTDLIGTEEAGWLQQDIAPIRLVQRHKVPSDHYSVQNQSNVGPEVLPPFPLLAAQKLMGVPISPSSRPQIVPKRLSDWMHT